DSEKLLPPPKGNLAAYVEHYKNKADNTVIISVSKKSKGNSSKKQVFENGIQVIHPLTNVRDYEDYESGEFVSVLVKDLSVKPTNDELKTTGDVVKKLIENYNTKKVIILYEESDEDAKNAKTLAKYAGIENGQVVPIIEREALEREVMRLSLEKPSFVKRAGITTGAVLAGGLLLYGAYKAGTLKKAGEIVDAGRNMIASKETETPEPIPSKKKRRNITIPHVSLVDVKYDWEEKKLEVIANADDKDGISILKGTINGSPVFSYSANQNKKIPYNEKTKIELKPGKYILKIKATDSQSDSGYASKEFEVVEKRWWPW
ncbi:MAG: hypothetical protein AABW88_05150, partial [Nanoarchaeota archaeon]